MNFEFKHKPGRQFEWEIYLRPQSTFGSHIFMWCCNTYGSPISGGDWDYHGGWIFFRHRKYVDWFLLRWSVND